LEALIVPLGLAAGYIISNFSKTELKAGKKYFNLLQACIFGAIVGVACWPAIGYWSIAAVLACFIFALRLTPIIILSVIAIITHYASIIPLAFLYTIPAASKEYPNKTKLLIAAILFLAIYYIPF